jgi:hypothetical protein
MREEGVVLEDRVGVAEVRRHRRDVATGELDATGVRPLEAGDHPKQGGLARAGWTEQREELALIDDEVDAVDGDDLAVVLSYPLEAKRRRMRFAQSRDAITCLSCVYSSSE